MRQKRHCDGRHSNGTVGKSAGCNRTQDVGFVRLRRDVPDSQLLITRIIVFTRALDIFQRYRTLVAAFSLPARRQREHQKSSTRRRSLIRNTAYLNFSNAKITIAYIVHLCSAIRLERSEAQIVIFQCRNVRKNSVAGERSGRYRGYRC